VGEEGALFFLCSQLRIPRALNLFLLQKNNNNKIKQGLQGHPGLQAPAGAGARAAQGGQLLGCVRRVYVEREGGGGRKDKKACKRRKTFLLLTLFPRRRPSAPPTVFSFFLGLSSAAFASFRVRPMRLSPPWYSSREIFLCPTTPAAGLKLEERANAREGLKTHSSLSRARSRESCLRSRFEPAFPECPPPSRFLALVSLALPVRGCTRTSRKHSDSNESTRCLAGRAAAAKPRDSLESPARGPRAICHA